MLTIFRQFFKVLLLCFVIFSGYTTIALAQSPDSEALEEREVKTVTIAATPEWYSESDIPTYPEARRDETRGGIEYLLFDDQYYYETGQYDYVSRRVFRVSDRKGLETAAQIQRSYDPELSELRFNSIRVIRGDESTDRLPLVGIRELQRESGLKSGIIDGDITALINLGDIRVGDIIDITNSGTVRMPLHPEIFSYTGSTSYSVPVARSYSAFNMPRDKRLYTHIEKAKQRVKINDLGDRTIYSFDFKDPEPDEKFTNIPADILTSGFYQVTTVAGWEDVANWAVDVYDIDVTLPRSAEDKIESIKREFSSDSDRLMAALRWVQDDVRYLGFEEGVNGYKPRTPAITLENGYGDCKDKSLLLKTALKKMNITSYVALVSSSSGELLEYVLPAINVFDHAIVMADLNGTIVYLDPTATYEGGNLENYGEPDFGYVLPIRKDQDELVKVGIPIDSYPVQEFSEHYEFQDNGALKFSVESRFHKHDADSMRSRLAREGISDITETFYKYYAERYPGLELVEPIQAKDDFLGNVIVLSESYLIPAEKVESEEYSETLQVQAYSIKNKIPDFIEPNRDFAVSLSRGLKLRHDIHIVTPGKEFTGPTDKNLSNHGVNFDLNYEVKGSQLSLRYSLDILEDRVALADAKDIVEMADDITDLSNRSINFKFAKEPLYVQLGMDKPIPEDVVADLRDISQLLRKDKNVDALESIRTLTQDYTSRDPLRGYIQSLHATILTELDRDAAAKPVFEEAFSLHEPISKDVYYKYIGMLYEDDDLSETAKIMGRLFKNHPDAATSLRYEWFWRLRRNLIQAEKYDEVDELLILLARAQLDNLDDIDQSDYAFEAAIFAMGRQNLVEDAKSLYDHIRTASTVRDILLDKEMQALWGDLEIHAGEGLSKARLTEVNYREENIKSDDATLRDYSRLLRAYVGNGQLGQALEVGEAQYENWNRIVAEGSDGFWFVNAYMATLHYAGEYDESDAVFEKLMTIGLDQENDLVNMILNHTSFLVDRGDFKKSLDTVSFYEDNEDFRASDYGMTFLWYAKACSQYRLGQIGEAEKTYKEKFLPISDSNPGSKTLLLLCMERDEEVAESLISRLQDEGSRPGVLPVFVMGTSPIIEGRFGDKIDQKLKAIAKREDVQSEFKKYGRWIKINGPAEIWNEF